MFKIFGVGVSLARHFVPYQQGAMATRHCQIKWQVEAEHGTLQVPRMGIFPCNYTTLSVLPSISKTKWHAFLMHAHWIMFTDGIRQKNHLFLTCAFMVHWRKWYPSLVLGLIQQHKAMLTSTSVILLVQAHYNCWVYSREMKQMFSYPHKMQYSPCWLCGNLNRIGQPGCSNGSSLTGTSAQKLMQIIFINRLWSSFNCNLKDLQPNYRLQLGKEYISKPLKSRDHKVVTQRYQKNCSKAHFDAHQTERIMTKWHIKFFPHHGSGGDRKLLKSGRKIRTAKDQIKYRLNQ